MSNTESRVLDTVATESPCAAHETDGDDES